MTHCNACTDESMKSLLIALDNSYDGTVIADKKGRIMYVNKTYERMSGFDRGELLGATVRDMVKDGLYKQKAYKSAIDYRKTVYHNQVFNKTNTNVNVICKPVFDTNNEIEIVISNVRLMDEAAQRFELSRIKDRYVYAFETAQQNHDREDYFCGEIISRSAAMREVINKVLKVSSVDVDILLEGETGTGKSTLAKLIYEKSSRARTGKFVEVNCSAIPYNLIESELFGYEKGSFTGANVYGKKGLFEEADNGIIFLDEIEELALDIQAKLLSVLQERRIRRIGSVESKKVNFQVIAASNKSLSQMVASQKFRQDLFYRLNVVPIVMPPLKERKEDIMPMANSFLETYNKLYRKEKIFSSEVINIFLNYVWPGNVRELANLVKSLVIISKDDLIQANDLPINLIGIPADRNMQNEKFLNLSLNDLVAEVESELITKALEEQGSLRRAAEALHITHSSLYRRMLKYNLNFQNEDVSIAKQADGLF